MSGYDTHQRDAVRLTCGRCAKSYDVTHAKPDAGFICVWCRKIPPSVCDVNGNQMFDP
jgi:hypothetical protein